MAMLFHEGYTHYDLKVRFNAARKNGCGYMGVVETVHADPYCVTCVETVVYANDSLELIRMLRERGLRPQAAPMRLLRVFDVRKDFNAQVALTGQAATHDAMTPEACAAYERYLLASKEDHAASPRKSWFGRIFGR